MRRLVVFALMFMPVVAQAKDPEVPEIDNCDRYLGRAVLLSRLQSLLAAQRGKPLTDSFGASLRSLLEAFDPLARKASDAPGQNLRAELLESLPKPGTVADAWLVSAIVEVRATRSLDVMGSQSLRTRHSQEFWTCDETEWQTKIRIAHEESAHPTWKELQAPPSLEPQACPRLLRRVRLLKAEQERLRGDGSEEYDSRRRGAEIASVLEAMGLLLPSCELEAAAE